MLFGVTTERIKEWLASAHDKTAVPLHGLAASPGLAEGRARVIAQPEQLADLQDGEILVAASTAPSWTPAFNKAAAVVVDIGGIMCHAAIVAREYGLPTAVYPGTVRRTDSRAGHLPGLGVKPLGVICARC